MSRYILRATSLAALLVTAGCQKAEKAPEAAVAAPETDVARAVAVTLGIKANEAAADSVLAAHGLTAEGFDSLMYTIASDSAKAAAYREAIR
jgi:hypothetical protein